MSFISSQPRFKLANSTTLLGRWERMLGTDALDGIGPRADQLLSRSLLPLLVVESMRKLRANWEKNK